MANIGKWNGLEFSVAPDPITGRAIVLGGHTGSSFVMAISFFEMSILSNSAYFGNLTYSKNWASTASNGPLEKLITSAGYHETITVNTMGNSVYNGGSPINWGSCGCSNHTNDRFIGCNGNTINNTIYYGSISTYVYPALFGYSIGTRRYTIALSNGTNERGLNSGAESGTASRNSIEYVTINSIGNAIYFGNLLSDLCATQAASDLTNERGAVFAGLNSTTVARLNYVQYLTINTLGDSAMFGDINDNMHGVAVSSSGLSERMVGSGGFNNSSVVTNYMQYCTLNTLGNCASFGTEYSLRYGHQSGTDA